jgi:hypothetical protein
MRLRTVKALCICKCISLTPSPNLPTLSLSFSLSQFNLNNNTFSGMKNAKPVLKLNKGTNEVI